MATREDYRESLQDKLLGLEDGGYGDFEFAESELNTYLDLVVSALFPALYRKDSLDGLSLTSYGSNFYAYATVSVPEDRVFLVEDAAELEPLRQWNTRPGRIIGLDRSATLVNVYYYTAYVMADDDVTDTEIPDEWQPVIVLGALIEALESRHDTGLRPEDMPMGYQQTSLIDRLTGRFERLKAEMAMSLPVRQV